jgi:hypothetical protein
MNIKDIKVGDKLRMGTTDHKYYTEVGINDHNRGRSDNTIVHVESIRTQTTFASGYTKDCVRIETKFSKLAAYPDNWTWVFPEDLSPVKTIKQQFEELEL